MDGLWAVLRKELLESTSRRRLLRGPLGYVVLLALIAGGIWPIVGNQSVVESQLGVIGFLLIFPCFSSSNVAAYAFAGERERRTLETLSVTPLLDWQLSLGKLAGAVVVGVGVSLLATVLAYGAHVLFRPGPAVLPLVPLLVLVLLGATATNTFTASLGAMLALRVNSPQMVYKLTSVASVLIFFVLRAERDLLLAGGHNGLLAFIGVMTALAAFAATATVAVFRRGRWLRRLA